ncbi:MAG: transcription termination/antitermination factor NusG, partial [Candidatus Riesia sp.]|nr:transcription termination/antitermination factor NusG [Candidatus Riesia sp.]
LRVVSGKEKKALELLENEVRKDSDLSKGINRVVLPLEKVFKVRNGKKYIKESNFFPGYLIMEADLSGEVLHKIEKTNYVIGFLKDGGVPQPLREKETNRILSKIDDMKENKVFVDSPFIVGENIVITDGPFTSFNAVVQEINNDKKIVKANVKIFGRETPIELSFLQIDRV